MTINRRSFLGGAAAWPFAMQGLGGILGPRPGTVPAPGCVWSPATNDRTLLVLELVGGNDGLNTALPIDRDRYAKLRPTLHEVQTNAWEALPDTWLNPGLQALQGVFEAGQGALVHSVGMEAPDRSHFRSRDIWHTALPEFDRVRPDTTGWLGRAADRLLDAGVQVPAASVGSLEVPLALRGRRVVVPSISKLEDFELRVAGAGNQTRERREELSTFLNDLASDAGKTASPTNIPRSMASFIADVAADSARQAERLRQATANYKASTDYPNTALGRHLSLASRIIGSGFGTRLFHLPYSGFDTHANQRATHDGLLRNLGSALAAFMADLKASGRAESTLVVVHSEFGRRAAENGSLGTDHGAAGPLFVLGGGVQAGAHGEPPDLNALVDGDVPATCDFRRVYASCLNWLGIEPASVLGEQTPNQLPHLLN